jgi:hypothetical protein
MEPLYMHIFSKKNFCAKLCQNSSSLLILYYLMGIRLEPILLEQQGGVPQ